MLWVLERSISIRFNLSGTMLRAIQEKNTWGGGGGGGGGDRRYNFLWVVGAESFQIIWVIGVRPNLITWVVGVSLRGRKNII